MWKLVTSRRLDREAMSETSVNLTCTDHGQQALTSDVTLVVHVLDANDNAPRFGVTSYGADVVENSFIGTFVARVSAVDDDQDDNALIHYILDRDRDTRDGTRRPQKDGRKRQGGVEDRGGRGQSELNGGECVDRVNVDKDSGLVTVSGLIDFEYTPVLRCRILAVDSGSPPKTGNRSAFMQQTLMNECEMQMKIISAE